MNKLKAVIIAIIIFISIAAFPQNSNYQLSGKVESLRKNNLLTIIFQQKPEKDEYFIIEDNKAIGKITIIDINIVTENKAVIYKASQSYHYSNADILLEQDTP